MCTWCVLRFIKRVLAAAVEQFGEESSEDVAAAAPSNDVMSAREDALIRALGDKHKVVLEDFDLEKGMKDANLTDLFPVADWPSVSLTACWLAAFACVCALLCVR